MSEKKHPEHLALFPHATVRPIQEALVFTVQHCLANRQHLVVHAPTGLGKTAAVLAPCLQLALSKDVEIIFLTSRHTQHKIVLDTLRLIKDHHAATFLSTSIIGKQGLCAQPNTHTLRSADFHAYCKALRTAKQCTFYENFKLKTNPQTPKLFHSLKNTAPNTTEYVLQEASAAELCPYEISLLLAAESKVTVTDYYYLLNPAIRENFLEKTGKKLGKTILVIDEGHNLPARARELLTNTISQITIARAIKEAKQHQFEKLMPLLNALQRAVDEISAPLNFNDERKISKAQLLSALPDIPVEILAQQLNEHADLIREEEKQSALGSIASFLESWDGSDDGFVRYIMKKESRASIIYRCLDPAQLTQELISQTYCTILMSGTLTPTSMYKEVLGFPQNTVERSFPSPFSAKNRLVLVVPQTTTKYSQRSPEQFKTIATMCANMLKSIPGHVAIFFPSYALRDAVSTTLSSASHKTVFSEQPGMTKEQKQDFLERFVRYKEAVLLGVAAGSFGEGVDLPGVLKAVIIVGLPLDRPTLETQELIAYYDKKYGKGWDYGYVLPAISKCMQNAGRCIRTEHDRGVIVFLDERYAWPQYLNAIPKEWDAVVTTEYVTRMKKFFEDTEK